MSPFIGIGDLPREKLACAIGICVGVAALVSHANEYAQFVQATADLSRGRLHDRLQPNGIVLRRHLADWIAAWLHWFWLSWGAIVAWIAITRRTKSQAVWTIGLGIALGWTALGVWYGVGNSTAANIAAGLFLNMAGGLIGSVIFILAVVTEEEFGNEKVEGGSGGRTGYKFGAIGGVYCLVTMVGMYYVVGLFVQTRHVDIRVAAKPPMQLFVTGERSGGEGSRSGRAGSVRRTGEVKVYFAQGLRWVWEAGHEKHPAGELFVAALSECHTIDEARKVAEGMEYILSGPVRRVEVRTDTSPLDVLIRGKQTAVAVEPSDLRLMWIGDEEEEGTKGLQEFLGADLDLVGSTQGTVHLFTRALELQEAEPREVHDVDVVWQVTLDDAVYEIRMPPLVSGLAADHAQKCKVVATTHEAGGLITEELGFPGLYLRIEPIDSQQLDAHGLAGDWRFERPSSWVQFGQLTQPDLDRVFRRKIQGVSLNDGVEEVYVDGTKIDVPVEARFRGFGDAWMWYSKGGRLITEGSFHASWVGSRRINQTTWEAMGVELRAMLVTGVLSALVAVGTIVYRRRERWLGAWSAPLR